MFAVSRDELADLVDDGEGVQVALALCLAPRKESVTAENDAVAPRIVAYRFAHHQAKFKSRSLPWNPDERMVELAIELLHLGFPVGRCGHRDAPVGMQMVHVREGKKAVQRCVNGRGDGIVAEGAKRVHRHHVIFGFNALVAALEREQLLLVERGKAGPLDAAEVAAGAFHPDHLNRFSRKRIRLDDLGTGVATGKVGDAQVRAKQVGAIAQKLRFIERGSDRRVPAVFEKSESCVCESCLRHSAPPSGEIDRSPDFDSTAEEPNQA